METAWDRAKRLSAITYKATPFQIVWCLVLLMLGSIGIIVNELASERSTLFHVAVYVLVGVVGVGCPFLCVFVRRLAKAPAEQREESTSALEALQEQSRLQLEKASEELARLQLRYEQSYRSALVIIRDDLLMLKDRVRSPQAQTWVPPRPGFVTPENHVVSLAQWKGQEPLYQALAAVYRTVSDIRAAEEGARSALYASLLERIDDALPLVGEAISDLDAQNV